MRVCCALVSALVIAWSASASAAEWGARDEALEAYFRAETSALAKRTADLLRSGEFNADRERYRRQLADMLGLDPMPEKTDLKPVVTGKLDHAEFTVEKLHFQSSPGLYVTANLYVPKGLTKPAPAVLYVCGHSLVKKGGVSYGNKTAYQHHGIWFARNGYVCLVVDTLQLGEIEGIHHGLYREKMWWWLSRGYTPAGVEAWNSIRAIDYLETRPEVDKSRIGMTGRSGGGAGSWYAAAIDTRIACAVPVAGITDLEDHVVHDCVEGHCDCMYFVNTRRWDHAMVAALIAPRPLLLCNTDKDSIFPLRGVIAIHDLVREVYRRDKAEAKFGLIITEGPHKDTQELQVAAFRWMGRHLKKDEGPAVPLAEKLFEPEQLRVFDRLPEDQRNTTAHEWFVPAAPAPAVPESKEAWAKQREAWMAGLREKVFAGWPQPHAGSRGAGVVHDLGHGAKLTLFDSRPEADDPAEVLLLVPTKAADLVGRAAPAAPAAIAAAAAAAAPDSAAERARAVALLFVRGVSPAWQRETDGRPKAEQDRELRRQTHVLRRYYLLGQTLDGQRVHDVRRAIQVLRERGKTKVRIQASGEMAAVALYASLFEEGVVNLSLRDLPPSHRQGPQFLNVLRVLDVPAAVAMAAERCEVTLITSDAAAWDYPRKVVEALGLPASRLTVAKK